MKNSKKLAIVLISLLLTGLLFAQSGRGIRGQNNDQRMDRFERMAQMLDLNEDQAKQITNLHMSNQRTAFEKRSKIRNLQDQLKLVETAEKFDQGKAESLVKEISQIRSEMQLTRIAHHQTIRKMLDDEQRAKFDAHLLAKSDKDGKGKRGGKRGKKGQRDNGNGNGWNRG